ncbi:DNA-directed RNA polymerase sigma-70 factor [Geothrix limicola]|uniref:RNA polymerase sigma factor n=1 Tax=Geothrix limicola TaxID=2927978 RepID=A0ABQ5QI25_9BACT|nr:RNA polymerase sigma factor [Geothrix limicola]GLH73993.1 DNA-directed RNA polymerase sigma-70 factor [Geothrix limicola]
MMATATFCEPLMIQTAPTTADRTPDPGSPYHTPEVLAWVEAAQRGDQNAFGSLVRLFSRDVYGKAFSILKNHQDADDVVQETFIRVFRALPGFRFESSFRTWLITITTRQALNYRERVTRDHESLDGPEGTLEHAALRVEETQIASLLDQEARRLLHEALPKLPKRQKEALTLKLQHDWKYEQIAQAMGTSVGSVKAHIFHAIQNLTRYVKGGRA